MIVFKKRYLLILIVLLLLIGAIVPFEIEKHKIVAVCRDALSSGGGDLKYEIMVFYPWENYASVSFSYRGDTAFCNVRRNGSEWEVTGAGFFGISPLP